MAELLMHIRAANAAPMRAANTAMRASRRALPIVVLMDSPRSWTNGNVRVFLRGRSFGHVMSIDCLPGMQTSTRDGSVFTCAVFRLRRGRKYLDRWRREVAQQQRTFYVAQWQLSAEEAEAQRAACRGLWKRVK